MKKELHPSEALAKFFSPRREEAPMLSAPEIERILERSDMLPNQSRNFINGRRLIMTLSGIAAIGIASYLAFFNPSSQTTKRAEGTNPSLKYHSSLTTPAKREISQPGTSAALPPKSSVSLRVGTRGPWSAGNDQIYADLTREELARLGIVVNGDTVVAYKLPPNDTIESMALTQHSIGGGNTKRLLPAGTHPPRFYPVLMTFGSGHGVAYILEDKNARTKEWGIVGDDSMNNVIRDWLHSPGIPGYAPVWWKTTSFRLCDTCGEVDKMRLQVGKNFAKPIFPFFVPQMDGFKDSTKAAIAQLAKYYCGKAEKPQFVFPKNLFINADTVTPEDMLREMDSDENTASMKRLRSTMARLNDLIPVIVRMTPGTGAPGPNDFIFWYEPSEELFNALPPAQAALFRAKLAEPPHCFTAPNAVLAQAEVTYCVDAPQAVWISVSDLTGRELLRWQESAVAGDNVSKFSTETLQSGMYLVTVKSAHGTKRTRRIWVENAYPKGEQLNTARENIPAAQSSLLDFTSLQIDSASLAGIGVESNEFLVAYYGALPDTTKVDYTGVIRSWGTILKTLDRSAVTNVSIPDFEPVLVTDGLGRKRLYTSLLDTNALAADSLIPILLKDVSTDSIGGTDLIFWYQPTPEFLAALPDSARAVAEAMIGGTRNESVAEEHGAIEQAIAFPNPSRGQFTVKLSVNGERTLTFTLRNLLGQAAAPPIRTQADGESDHTLDFGTVPEGVYLLDITSDQGERYIERVVIAR